MPKLRHSGSSLRLWWYGEDPPEDLASELVAMDVTLVDSVSPPWTLEDVDTCFASCPPAEWPPVSGRVPLIALLPQHASADAIDAVLDAGAFDVLCAPYSAAELASRALAARRYRVQKSRTYVAELNRMQLEKTNEELSRDLRWSQAECQRAIEDANKAKDLATVGTFAAGIAHQINNPLTGVVGFGELLLQRDDLDESVVRDLERMVKEAKRAARIIREMLDLTRTCVRTEAVDVNALLQRTIDVPQVALTLEPIEVDLQLEKALPFVGGDAFRLQQVFQNLLENSAHALDGVESAKIVISTVAVSPGIQVRISDNGPGVAPEAKLRLFEAFFTTKTTRKRRGTGLGLALCRSIAREHMGDVFYETSDMGGACFVVRLPRIDQQADSKQWMRRAV